MGEHKYQADVCVIGGGLAGISTAYELLDHGLKVIILDRDKRENFGGLAKESFGGIMFVDSPHQRKLGIKDNPELALHDWHSFARFEDEDGWPQKWAKFYVQHSISHIYEWLDRKGVSFLPLVNWAERGLYEPGNSVPRWHIAWGTGKGIIDSILNSIESHPLHKNLQLFFEHNVENIRFEGGRVSGCQGKIENEESDFEVVAENTVIASGGICGGDLSTLKKHWYGPWGKMPENVLNGAHKFGDGKLHFAAQNIGGNLTNMDKHWHYAAGVHHPNPRKYRHGLSLVPPRSALWMDKYGKRVGPMPLMGYTDTRSLVERITALPGQYTWQIMNWKIAIKELSVSGSEYMTAFRDKNKLKVAKQLIFGNKELVNRMLDENEDFVSAKTLHELVDKMNIVSGENCVKHNFLKEEIERYDARIDQGKSYFNDEQLRRLLNFRQYRGDRVRLCKFQKILDKKALPLIAVREHILVRKSLGGIQTDLSSRVLKKNGEVINGLYAAGETAGFGGGGIHGYGSLEGTFLGSCILTGRIAGQAISGKL